MKSPRRKAKRRGRNLSDEHIQLIVEILDGWTGPLTWKLLIDDITKRLHNTYTRQTLHKHDRISNAFRLTKAALENQPTSSNKRPFSAEMRAALQHIKRLKAENTRLNQENDRLLDQFEVWAYNATNHGVTESILNTPLPKVTRRNAPAEKGPRPVKRKAPHA